MIAAGVPPRRCRNCQTTWASCVDAREYRSAACCTGCDHDDDRPRTCDECGAYSLACARKSAFGGRACCSACTHVQIRNTR